MDYSEWTSPTDRWCRAWRTVRLDGGGVMNQSCGRKANHEGDHVPLPIALPSTGVTATLPGVATYTS